MLFFGCSGIFLPVSLQMISHYFNNVEVRSLGRAIYDRLSSNVCFSIKVYFYCIAAVLGIIIMRKNEAPANHLLSRWHCIVNKIPTVFLCLHKSISFDKIPNITEPVDFLYACHFYCPIHFFKDTLHSMLRYATFSANSFLGIALLVQKYYLMPVKLYFL